MANDGSLGYECYPRKPFFFFFDPYSFSQRNLVKIENDTKDSNEREMRLT